MLAKAQAAAAQAAQQAREAAERAAKQGTEALADARNKASTLDTDTLMGNAVEGLESRLSGSFAKVSQLAEKSATSPMPSVGPASSTPKKRALDNLQREVSTGRHTPRWPISRSPHTLPWQELVALVRQERDTAKKRKAELATLRRAAAAALLPSAGEGDEAVDTAMLVQALEAHRAGAGAGAGAGACAAPEGRLQMVESSAAESELLELQVPACLHATCSHLHATRTPPARHAH